MENEVDKFLDGLTNEPKEDPFKPEADELFAETATDGVKKEKEDEEKEEKPLPFHKDPKVQKFIDKEIEKRLKDIKPEPAKPEVKNDDNPLTDVLVRIIGNDTPEKQSAIKDFTKALGGMKEEAKLEALKEIEARSEQVRQAEINAQKEISEGFEDIEESFSVDLTSNTPIAKKTRTEFVDFIKRIAPKDEDGQVSEFPDFKESFTVFQEMKKSATPPNRGKELAARSMSRSTDTSSAPQTKGNSWNDVENWLSKLTG